MTAATLIVDFLLITDGFLIGYLLVSIIKRIKRKTKMGYYINPPDMTKEAFLRIKGMPISPTILEAFWHSELKQTPTDYLPVCLVYNPFFTAAVIAYSPYESAAFDKEDGRQKDWYLVLLSDLKPYYDKENE